MPALSKIGRTGGPGFAFVMKSPVKSERRLRKAGQSPAVAAQANAAADVAMALAFRATARISPIAPQEISRLVFE